MEIIRVLDPTSEVVSLKEVKDFLRIDNTVEDDQLSTMIMSATALVEKYLNRSLITQTWQLSTFSYPPTFRLLYGPIQTITSISHTLSDNTNVVLDPTTYVLVTKNTSPRVMPSYGNGWPNVSLQVGDSVVVEYITGYGDTANDVPQNIRQGILHMIEDMYDDREMVSNISDSVKKMISNEKVYTF